LDWINALETSAIALKIFEWKLREKPLRLQNPEVEPTLQQCFACPVPFDLTNVRYFYTSTSGASYGIVGFHRPNYLTVVGPYLRPSTTGC
jgi:hypothetical protein